MCCSFEFECCVFGVEASSFTLLDVEMNREHVKCVVVAVLTCDLTERVR